MEGGLAESVKAGRKPQLTCTRIISMSPMVQWQDRWRARGGEEGEAGVENVKVCVCSMRSSVENSQPHSNWVGGRPDLALVSSVWFLQVCYWRTLARRDASSESFAERFDFTGSYDSNRRSYLIAAVLSLRRFFPHPDHVSVCYLCLAAIGQTRVSRRAGQKVH
jgi:hypothetical protein